MGLAPRRSPRISRDVFRAARENDAGRGQVGAPAPVSIADAVSDAMTLVCPGADDACIRETASTPAAL